jgi:glycyl-tRNA synthetase beta chain
MLWSEFFCEEIPAGMQLFGQNEFKDLFDSWLISIGFKDFKSESFSTPRRLIFSAEVPDIVPSIITEIKGPRVDAQKSAIDGFLSKNKTKDNAKDIKIIEKETEKGTFLFAVETKKSIPLFEALQDGIDYMFENFVWPKSMRWGLKNASWIRPINHILIAVDDKVFDSFYNGIRCDSAIIGHRAKFNCYPRTFREYKNFLKTEKIEICRESRKNLILDSIKNIEAQHDISFNEDSHLVDEITGLVEYPHPLVGNIEKKFMHLPEELIISVMKTHQRYISFREKNGKLSQKFCFISNLPKESVVKGNEMVLSARLSDGAFYFEKDTQIQLENFDIEKRMFHKKLGSMQEKSNRLADLALFAKDFFCKKISENDIKRVGALLKKDLSTGVVEEFPELQGIMGSKYASKKENKKVCKAIASHYGKTFDSTDKLGMLYACVDRIDSLVGFFGIGERPTGSKDPFAIRRLAISLTKIIIDHSIDIDLEEIISKSINIYNIPFLEDTLEAIKTFIKSKYDHKIYSNKINPYIWNKKYKEIDTIFSDIHRQLLKRLFSFEDQFKEINCTNNEYKFNDEESFLMSQSFECIKDWPVEDIMKYFDNNLIIQEKCKNNRLYLIKTICQKIEDSYTKAIREK